MLRSREGEIETEKGREREVMWRDLDKTCGPFFSSGPSFGSQPKAHLLKQLLGECFLRCVCVWNWDDRNLLQGFETVIIGLFSFN